MKLNRKGFMMAEVVVVSAVVLITLTSLYISYNKLYSLYSTRLTYTDVSTIYRLAYYRDCLIDKNNLNTLKESTKDKAISITTGTTYLSKYDKICDTKCAENVFLIYNNKKNISKNIDLGEINKTYSEYINYLANSVDLKGTDYVMIMERCNKQDDSGIYNKDCYYGYLEIN